MGSAVKSQNPQLQVHVQRSPDKIFHLASLCLWIYYLFLYSLMFLTHLSVVKNTKLSNFLDSFQGAVLHVPSISFPVRHHGVIRVAAVLSCVLLCCLACGLAEWRASRSRTVRRNKEAAAAESAEQWSGEASRHQSHASTQRSACPAQPPGGAHRGRTCCRAGRLTNSSTAIHRDAPRASTPWTPGRTPSCRRRI